MLGLTAATAALVFLRAWQQQNVIHGFYFWAAGTSYLIAAADIFVVLGVVKTGLSAIMFVGTGGSIGVVAAMWLHRRLKR